MIYETHSEEETYKLAKDYGRRARPYDIFCLTGELAAGKTVFAKGIALALCVTEIITSPTFTIMNTFDTGRLPFFHFDAYRVKSLDEMRDIGFTDYIKSGGVCVIEWANLIKPLIPGGIWIDIKIGESGIDHRIIEVTRC